MHCHIQLLSKCEIFSVIIKVISKKGGMNANELKPFHYIFQIVLHEPHIYGMKTFVSSLTKWPSYSLVAKVRFYTFTGFISHEREQIAQTFPCILHIVPTAWYQNFNSAPYTEGVKKLRKLVMPWSTYLC